MKGRLRLGDREVGDGLPCLVIAEAGVNHDGSVARARALVDAAVDAGCDAVKFQTFDADRLATPSAPKAPYQRSAVEETQQQMLRRLALSAPGHRELAAYCASRKIMFLSSAFDEESADLVESLGVPAFKVPSGELTNIPLLKNLAARRKPLLISTGMATLEEVDTAVRAVIAGGAPPFVLLHCTSSYPADPADVNLRAINTLRSRFGVPVGYSDHTLGCDIALAAVSLGACVIEKHVTYDRQASGPDHQASLDPAALKDFVTRIRSVERALGSGEKTPAASEQEVAAVARKSVVALREILAGSVITEDMLGSRRPGTGLPPDSRAAMIGRRVRRSIPAGALISWDAFEERE